MRELHPWDLSAEAAVRLQRRLARQLVLRPSGRQPELVAGADAAYEGDRVWAAAVLMRLPELEVVEEAVACQPVRFPYVPGLLSFREGPALLAALQSLSQRPQAVLFDGQGIAHPRGLGIAAHLGLWLDLPSAGCAKSRLWGHYREPPPEVGSWTPLRHGGRVVGAVLRTRPGVKPVFVSPGHRMDLMEALRLVQRCCRGYRLPEPVRRAHLLAERAKRSGLGRARSRP